MKIGNNGNLVLGPFDETTPCLMIVLMNCQTKLRINHLTAVKSVTILERAPIKLISDNGPQFISDIFENLNETLGIRHVKTVVYRPQGNRIERVNRDLVKMIANYVNNQHDTWDQFLREFAYAILTVVNETTGKTSAELFLGRKLISLFQKLVMVSDGTEFPIDQGERHTGKTDKRRPLIRSLSGSWSEPSRKLKISRKETIGYKQLRGSGSGGPERKIKKGRGHRVAKKTLSLNYTNDLTQFRKKLRKEKTVMASTSGYNLRPRRGAKVESHSTSEMRTQQGGPVQARKRREHHYRPYIKEQARSSSKNTSRRSRQQNFLERKGGANSNRSISLEVLVGDINNK
ncbi:uncharacterized protein TNCV_3990361 [Trichonephila clavipes]|uniref:Integrase catalytic domain-containing protein n=1 Tax=Trichonephila clavipes TaxID=2585209 RepID=A0A8X6VJF4_TRICX|nr:uncharacterized protein TNCV_3990361 [Trichonephila clavipes]